MTVNHYSGAQGLESAMQRGGTHAVVITPDEMPELIDIPGTEDGVEIACVHYCRNGMWSEIVGRLAARGGRCLYKKADDGAFYEVICTIPPP